MNTIYRMQDDSQRLLEQLLDENIDVKDYEEFKKNINIEKEIEKQFEDFVISIKEIDAEIEKWANEKRRIDNKLKSLKNSKDYYRQFLQDIMTIHSLQKVKTEHFSVSKQKNKKSVIIENESLIPDEYIEFLAKPKKDLILKSYEEDGLIVDGVRIEQTESVRIR